MANPNHNTTSQINIAFFGTSDRSIPVLNSLYKNFNLKLCITKRDSLFGRKKILKPTEVKQWSRANNIPIFELNQFKNEEVKQLLEMLKSLEITYAIVADFSYIIPGEIITYFDNKLINIHFSLLPKYRGASPVQFAIKNGDEKTGITFQLVSNELDKGAIIYQYEYILPNNKSSGEIYDEMFIKASELLPDVLTKYSKNEISLTNQDESEATYTYSKTYPKRTTIFKEDAEIDWNENPKDIYNQIRAYNPWPIAWTNLFKFELGYLKKYKPNCRLKSHINRKLTLKINKAKLDNNQLNLLEVQVEGKKIVSWKDFVNGYLECN